MMKKITCAFALLGMSCSYAGTMGPMVTSPLMGYISGEGGYAWNKIKGINASIMGGGVASAILGLSTNQNNQGGTGRLAVGMIHQINTLLFLSGEVGWGYYGETTSRFNISGVSNAAAINSTISGVNLKNTLWGFDVLAGVVYNQPQYDLFFKAGALMENSQLKFNTGNLSNISSAFTGSAVIKSNKTEALPVIKVGASYHIWDNLAVFAAWTHAFGSNEQLNANVALNTPITVNVNANLQNPTLDIVTGGLTYRFA